MLYEGIKIEIIKGCYSQMRISGLTVKPGPEENEPALDRLENMAAEYKKRNICTNYNLEDNPKLNSKHNLDREYWYPFQITLANRLLNDFGKVATPDFIKQVNAATSFLYSSTAVYDETQYPSRQARGSGNTLRYNRWQRFYRQTAVAPNECATNVMFIEDIDNFVEHFDSYMMTSEQIQSYTIEANDGLTILSDSLNNPDIDYTIRADGSAEGRASDNLLKVKIVATMTSGRVETRIINFELKDSRIAIN